MIPLFTHNVLVSEGSPGKVQGQLLENKTEGGMYRSGHTCVAMEKSPCLGIYLSLDTFCLYVTLFGLFKNKNCRKHGYLL